MKGRKKQRENECKSEREERETETKNNRPFNQSVNQSKK